MILACATFTAFTVAETAVAAECDATSASLRSRLLSDSSAVLQIVSSEVGSNPNCACEVVKGAIGIVDADVALVTDIAEAAITAAPENAGLIAQCAVAARPQSESSINALLARLEQDSAAADLSDASLEVDFMVLPNPPFTVIVPNTPIPGDVSNPNNPDAPGFVPPVVAPEAPVAPGAVTDPNPG